MERIVDLIAARLLEGSVVPFVGPGAHDAPPFPSGPRALADALATAEGVPGHAGEDLGGVAEWILVHRGREALDRAVAGAFAVPAPPPALDLLLAGLPELPLAVSAWYDPTLAELLADVGPAGDRSVAVAHGVPPGGEDGAPFAWILPDGADAPGSAATVVYQPLGASEPAPGFVVAASDWEGVAGGLASQAAIPAEVQRRRAGRGFLLAGCRFEAEIDRLVTRAVLARSAGPHFAVLEGEPTAGEARFLADAGVLALPVGIERFVAKLSRALAARSRRSAGPLAATEGRG